MVLKFGENKKKLKLSMASTVNDPPYIEYVFNLQVFRPKLKF